MVKVAWSNLLDDVDRIGNKKGFVWTREEDIRSYLFCKIADVLMTEEKWLTDLQTEVRYGKSRLDLALGNNGEDKFILGVEIKRGIIKNPVLKDINKLKTLMDRSHIRAGIFIGFSNHRQEDHWRKIFENWFSEISVDMGFEDLGHNNYLEIREIKPFRIPDKGSEKECHWDSVFIVIRR